MSITPTPSTNKTPEVRPGAIRQDLAPGYGGYNQGLAPYGAPPPDPDLGSSNIDIWGAILRRKFVVILLGTIGAGLGYLHFSKTPATYESAMRLQVTTLNPPAILVDGQMVIDKSSGRNQNLLTSQLVLGNAIEDFKSHLEQTNRKVSAKGLFADPEAELQNVLLNLTVEPVNKSDETLYVALQGPDSDELPEYLQHIKDSFEKVIEQDNKVAHGEMYDLIEQHYKSITSDVDTMSREFQDLQTKLGPDALIYADQIANPYTEGLRKVKEEVELLQESIRAHTERRFAIRTAIDSGNPIQLQVAVSEAKREVGLHYDQRLAEDKQSEDYKAKLRDIEEKIEATNKTLIQLDLNYQTLSATYGPGHRAMQAAIRQIESTRDQMNTYVQERAGLLLAAQEAEKERENDSLLSSDEFKNRTDREWIEMYLFSLEEKLATEQALLVEKNKSLKKLQDDSQEVQSIVTKMRLLSDQLELKRRAAEVSLQQLSEIRVLSSNHSQTKVTLLDQPSLGRQVDPILAKSLIIGILLGGLLGAGLALLIDRADHLFRSPQEIFQLIGAPVLGRIPRIRMNGRAGAGSVQLITSHQTNSSFTESFRAARTGLFFASQSEDVRMILCTSPSPGDGKSTTVANLALSMAQAGKRVLLVDADFRRPRVDRYFGIETTPGSIDYLEGRCSLAEAIRESHQENLFTLTTGGRPKNPGELVASNKFLDMLATVRDRFDYVLIDSPPILPVADPCVIASHVDGVILVMRIRKGVKVTAQKSKESLQRVGARIIGIIVNGLDENPFYNEYGYQYGTHYRYNSKYYDRQFADYHDKAEAARLTSQ